MYLTAELDMIWAERWGLKGGEWRIWSEVCIEAIDRAGWQRVSISALGMWSCTLLQPSKHIFSSFVFPAVENSLRRENHTKTSYHHSLLSHWFLAYHTGIFPWPMTLGGLSRKQQRVKRHCSWARFPQPLSLGSWLHYRNISVRKRYEYSKKPNKSGDVPRCNTNQENCRCFLDTVSSPADDCRSRVAEVSGTLYVVQ